MVKDAFQKLQKIVKNSKLPLDIRKWILDCYVKPILTYDSESGTISSQILQRLQAAGNVVLLRSNDEFLSRAETKQTLLDDHKKEAA